MFIRMIAFILVVIGAAGFFMPFWIGAVVSDLSKLELPLSEVSDVAVSEDGEIYFALTFLGRIQKYSASGEFIQGLDVDSGGGQFCLTLAERELAVYVARRDAVDKYDLAGNVIRLNAPIDENTYRKSCIWDERVRSIDYSINKVSVLLSDANEPISIRRRLWHCFAPGPFASWLIFVVGLTLIPEWRRAVFSAFPRKKILPADAKPKGRILKFANFVLNLIFTLYALALTAIGLLIIVATTGFGSSGFTVFTAALGGVFVLFSFFWIYKLWTSYDGEIRLAPGISFEVGPAGAVAWKAFVLALLAAFIFSVFYFGEKMADEARGFDPLSMRDQLSWLRQSPCLSC